MSDPQTQSPAATDVAPRPKPAKRRTPPSPTIVWLEEQLKPDAIKATLDANFEAVRLFQSAILIRNPTAFVGLFLFVNLHFYAYVALKPPAYCLLLAPLVYYLAARAYWADIWPPVYDILFSEKVEDGDAAEPNRIRTSEELVPVIVAISSPILMFLRVIDKLVHVKTRDALKVKLVILLCLFAFCVVDFFWILWGLANFVLLLPGVLYYPAVREVVDIVKSMLETQLASL